MNSHAIFQGQMTDMAAAFELAENGHLGFGLNVNHDGFKVDDAMPTRAMLDHVECHHALGRVTVTVYDDPASQAATDADIAARVYAIAAGAIPQGRVWDRMRFATDETEFEEFYRDLEGDYNVWFVRRVDLTNERAGGIDDDLVSRDHEFEFRYLRAIVDEDDV